MSILRSRRFALYAIPNIFFPVMSFFEQKYRIFKIAQDLQSYKISFNVQNLVYFSVPSLSAGASPLRLL